jgi:hypothetical protein
MLKRAWRERYTVAENVLMLLSMILLMVVDDDDGVVERSVRKVDARLNGGALKRCFCNGNGFWDNNRAFGWESAFVVVMLWTGDRMKRQERCVERTLTL